MPDPIPVLTDFDITTGDTSSAVRTLIETRAADAGAWATWAATMLQTDIADITALLGSDTVDADLAAISAALDAIPAFTAGAISGGDAMYSSAALTALESRLATDVATYSTGLGTAEAALFARETARQNAARSAAYTEITTQFSSRGWDSPPGAILAKQTEMNNESTIRLADSSAQIMAESARLAVDYNKGMLTVAIQLQQLLAQTFGDYQMRLFEASKASVMYAVEGFKATLSQYTAKAEIALKEADLVLGSKARQLALEVSTLQGLANGATQMVAASLNGIAVSASMGYSATSAASQDRDKTVSVHYQMPEGSVPPAVY